MLVVAVYGALQLNVPMVGSVRVKVVDSANSVDECVESLVSDSNPVLALAAVADRTDNRPAKTKASESR
jgi:hypothetical protein